MLRNRQSKRIQYLVGLFFVFCIFLCMKSAVQCMNINILIATRDSKIPSYAEIDNGQIYLVFAQLAQAIHGNSIIDVVHQIIEKKCVNSPDNIKKQIASMLQIERPTYEINKDRPILILFNEMFFGRDYALTEDKVESVINCYRDFISFFPNTYLYINFLYKAKMDSKYLEQVNISKQRYREINELEINEDFKGFSSIWFSSYCPPNYTSLNKHYLNLVLSNDINSSIFDNLLLFNQTKIFFNGEEIGFYNKSSFCSESLPDFISPNTNTLKGKIPFYVIGDFSIHWLKEHNSMLDNITHLICYDTDTVLNLKRLPSRKHICLFISNTYDTLFASINDRKNKGDFDHIYVCSDPKGIIPNKIEQLKIDDLNKCVFAITGIFSTSDKNLVPLKNIPEFMRFDFCFPPKGRTINDYKIYGFEL